MKLKVENWPQSAQFVSIGGIYISCNGNIFISKLNSTVDKQAFF